MSGRFRLSRRADGAGDFRSRKIADDLRYFRRSHRVEAVPTGHAPSKRLQDPVRHGRQAGTSAGEGVPECSAGGLKQAGIAKWMLRAWSGQVGTGFPKSSCSNKKIE